MTKMSFNSNDEPTLGVEIELALVDEQTMALSSSIHEVIARVPEALHGSIKPELMQCYLEISTDVCRTVAAVETDLREKIQIVERVTDEIGLRLYWTGTHPFSLWSEQEVTPNERYEVLLKILQDMGRQLVTFGLHVHVGVNSGDKAIMICDRIMRHLPTLLALSCNSPWWNNRVTGLQSHRSKIMEGLPTAGLPTLMRNWSEYVWLISHLVETGFINTHREIWWDVRPHHGFGTVEVRVCDMPGNLDDTLTLVALIHALVQALSEDIDHGAYQHDCHPMMVRQNKWRASRYGMDARLVDSFTFEQHPARTVVTNLVRDLASTADRLGNLSYLQRDRELAAAPTWADRQLEVLERTKDPVEVVREMTEASRILPAPKPERAAK